jgi:hypothetical protein
MAQETVFPTSPRRWLLHMRAHGVSTRPYDRQNSDRVDLNYPDPLDIKPERSAIASIFATRAYMWARNSIQKQALYLSEPSSTTLTSAEDVQSKFVRIGTAFVNAMSQGLKRDEKQILQRPDDDPIKKDYRRLEDLLSPARDAVKPGDLTDESFFGGKQIYNRNNMVYNEIFGGVEPLPSNIFFLIGHTFDNYYDRFGNYPSVKTALKIMYNSYDTYVKVNARRHQAGIRNTYTP